MSKQAAEVYQEAQGIIDIEEMRVKRMKQIHNLNASQAKADEK